MDREGFRNRLQQYKKAREENPGLKYWDWRNSLPDNLKYTNDYEYDMQGAYEAGMLPEWNEEDQQYHLGSRDPKTGRILKRFGHPTYYKALEEDAKLGYKTYLLGGNTYTWNDIDGPFIPWREISKYDEGGKVVPTQEEYIAQQIAAEKAAALEKSLTRTMPKVPLGEKRGERWNPYTRKVENIYELGSSCAYTFADNYGLNWMSSEDFRQNHADYGWRLIPWESRQPGDAVLIVDDKGTARHTMMYDSDNAQGQPLFNHSNGGHDESAIRKKAKYPHHNPYLTYEYVGTPADSTQWINDYKKIYGYADGGEVELNPLEVLERSRPKVAGIPINDKPLSGTDPIGELYVNLVSGNALRKILTNSVKGIVKKSIYDSYKDFLKAGFNRRAAYSYAGPDPGIDVLPGLAKGFDYTIKGANYIHALENFIK